MQGCSASDHLCQLHCLLDKAQPKLTFFGGRSISTGGKLSELTEKVKRCAREWRNLNCSDRLAGLQLQRKIRDCYVQIEKDLPKYNIVTRFFAYIRMFELGFLNFDQRYGLYIFPKFTNKIDLFKRSLDWRSQANFCIFTEEQLRTSFPQLWKEWQEGDQSKIKKEPDPFAEIYSLDPNWLLKNLPSPAS